MINNINVSETLNIDNKYKNMKVVEMLIDEHAEPKKCILLEEKQVIVDDKERLLSELCYKHLKFSNILNIAVCSAVCAVVDCASCKISRTSEQYLLEATDSALNLVEQFHRFIPWYILIRQLDDIQDKFNNLKIYGINFLKADNIVKRSRMEPNNVVGVLNYPKNIYESVFEMFRNCGKYDNKESYSNMTKSDILNRNGEIEQSYVVEEMNLYNCINDFNQKMSTYLVMDNRERIKSAFMKSIKC